MKFLVQGLLAMIIMFTLAVIIAGTPTGKLDAGNVNFDQDHGSAAWFLSPLGGQ
jgi:hypothetical protein